LERRLAHGVNVVPANDVAEILGLQRDVSRLTAPRIIGQSGVDAVPEPQHALGDALAP
jgi:hypothetical protein